MGAGPCERDNKGGAAPSLPHPLLTSPPLSSIVSSRLYLRDTFGGGSCIWVVSIGIPLIH